MKIIIMFGSRFITFCIDIPAEKIIPNKSVDALLKSLHTRYKYDLITMMKNACKDDILRKEYEEETELKIKEEKKELAELNWFQKLLINLGRIDLKQIKGPRK